MRKTSGYLAAVLMAISLFPRAAYGINVTENADGGPSPQMMANTIVDEASGITVVTNPPANTTINASGSPSSDTDAFGSFTNGITPAGTLLPTANQNASGTETYAGGIQISSGVCFTTGVLEDEPNASRGAVAACSDQTTGSRF